jgi:hypothetical protein
MFYLTHFMFLLVGHRGLSTVTAELLGALHGEEQEDDGEEAEGA